jgi:Arc/MetJ family transcription regulator
MRTTLDINDDLLREAQARVAAPTKTALIELALEALIRQAAQESLAAAGGTMPDLEDPRRRRPA